VKVYKNLQNKFGRRRKTKAPQTRPESWDARSNSPPPKSAHNQPMFWPALREWLQCAKRRENALPVQHVAIYNQAHESDHRCDCFGIARHARFSGSALCSSACPAATT